MNAMKPGAKTSEAWGGAAVIGVLVTAASSATPMVQAVCYGGAALVAAAYALSRGLAKGKAPE